MKKIIFFLIMLLLPVSVMAVSYDIENIFIDAEVVPSGDLKVKELIVLDGTFNGYIRDIVYKNGKLSSHKKINFEKDAIYNASGLTDVTIKAKKVNGKVSFETMDETFDSLSSSSSTTASNKNYVEMNIPNGFSYKIYYQANHEKVAFLLEYTIEDVVVLHNDIAEVYWTFIGDGFEDEIENLQIRVRIPDYDEALRLWAHGELTGEIKKIDDKTVLAQAVDLNPNSPVDIRLSFNKYLVNGDIKKQTDEKALNEILKVEQKRADEANQIRENAKRVLNIVSVVSGLYMIGLIICWIYTYIKYDKEYKPDFNLEYNREFIDDYNVEVVDYLMNKRIGENAFSASILNLVYKKNIKVEELKSDSKEKIYEFTLLTKENTNSTEQKLLDFLYTKVGKENKFTTKELKKYASSTKTYTTFQSNYSAWLHSALEDAKKENFYESKSQPVIFSLLFLFLGVLLVIITGANGIDLILPYLCGALSLIFVFYCAFLSKRTKRGNNHYRRWKAFKKFLEDFGAFDIKQLPEIALWERYLVYATVFGIADKVQKAMNVKIKELNVANTYSYNLYWIDYSIASSVNRSIHDSFQANRSTYNRQTASSSYSSGSGGGGGFSSGGGFGGGGGGGRGF